MKYFAYGANLSLERFADCCPESKLLGQAILSNYSFFINSSGVSSISCKDGAIVQGLVWDISIDDEELLDIYEGVAGGFYEKDIINIPDFGNCLVYFATDTSHGLPRSGYLGDIILNAEKHKFEKEYIDFLKSLFTMKDF